jgi:hypothetical protein
MGIFGGLWGTPPKKKKFLLGVALGVVGRWGCVGWVGERWGVSGWVGVYLFFLFLFYFILFYFCLFLHFACNSLVSVQCSYFVCLFVYIRYLGSVYINLMCFLYQSF